MNNDPFAHGQPPEFLPDESVLPQRTSIMAILSLVFSLICCIPGLGAIGAIFGGVSLVSISRSRGRITGTGLAVTGIVIGLLVSIIWIGSFAALGAGMGAVFSGADDVMSAVENDNPAALRAALQPSATVTDAEIDAFRAAYQAEYGGYTGMPTGLLGQIEGWLSHGPAVQTAMNRAQGVFPPPNSPFPLSANFDQGSALLIMVMQGGSQSNAPSNVGVVAKDGSIIWLIDPTGGTAAPAGP
jgi:hypothetical protein